MIETKYISRTGYSVRDFIRWEIISDEPLTDDVVSDVIEKEYPHAGYGPSRYSRIAPNHVEVLSHASCD